MSAESKTHSGESRIADVIDNGPFGARQILLIAFCLLVNMLDGFDITAMAVVANSVISDLHISSDQLGWVFSCALAGMMGGAMILAPIADLAGRRNMIIIGIVLVGVSILLTATAGTLSEFLILRFISGLGAGTVLACQAALAAEYSPERYRALSVAVVTSGYPLGAMMTSIGAAFILPEYGWRGMFGFGGALTCAMTLAAWFFVPESLKFLIDRRPTNSLAKANKILAGMKIQLLEALPNVSVRADAVQPGLSKNVLALLGPEHKRATLTLWTAFFLCFATLYFMMSWIPKLVEDAGHGFKAGRDAFFLFNLGGVVGIYGLGWLSTRWRLYIVICVMLIASALCMAAFALSSENISLMMVLILMIGIFQQGGFAGLYSAAAKTYPTGIRSTGIGWAIGLGRTGAVVGPATAGYLIASGLDMSDNFIVFAIPMAIGGLIARRLKVS